MQTAVRRVACPPRNVPPQRIGLPVGIEEGFQSGRARLISDDPLCAGPPAPQPRHPRTGYSSYQVAIASPMMIEDPVALYIPRRSDQDAWNAAAHTLFDGKYRLRHVGFRSSHRLSS